VGFYLELALIAMRCALRNEARKVQLRGRPRRECINDDAALARADQIIAETGERRPYVLARLALPDDGDTARRRLVRRLKART
jgi:hypothetical protein